MPLFESRYLNLSLRNGTQLFLHTDHNNANGKTASDGDGIVLLVGILEDHGTLYVVWK